MARYFPICLSLSGADCLVVGGGRVACRKIESLLACGAHVQVVSPRFCPEVAALEGIDLAERRFQDSDVDGATVVFAATDDPEVNRQVARAARERHVWVNVVDTPELCDFIVPATVSRGDLIFSVATGGSAPALSRSVRKQLEALFPESYADYVALLGELRVEVIDRVPEADARKTILRGLAEDSAWRQFQDEGPDALRNLCAKLLAEHSA